MYKHPCSDLYVNCKNCRIFGTHNALLDSHNLRMFKNSTFATIKLIRQFFAIINCLILIVIGIEKWKKQLIISVESKKRIKK
jgi:hypothetical protein